MPTASSEHESRSSGEPSGRPVDESATSPSAAGVSECQQALATLTADDLTDLDDDARLGLLRQLEQLTRSAAAVSARLQVDFGTSQLEHQQAAGVPRSRRGKAIADELAHARMTSPYWGSRELASARALVQEMPKTLAALADAQISALQARSVTEATTCLSVEDRAEVDRRLAPRLDGSSTQEITAAARALVYEIDPAAYVARARKAAKDRGVSVRPAPDVMARLNAHLPAHQAVACYAALRTHATAARASGDPRGLNQLMADELYQRLTGRAVVDGVDIEVGVVITDRALFSGASGAAELAGYGPIPAEVARDLLRPDGESDHRADTAHGANPGGGQLCPQGGRCTVASCELLHGPPVTPPASPPSPAAPASPAATSPSPSASATPSDPAAGDSRDAIVWLRRLWTDPVTGVLVEQDARRRRFTGDVRRFVISRDRTCRNRWCGAPIRDVDHIVRHSDGGQTTVSNGRGLCHRCNLARERHRHRPAQEYRSAPPLLTRASTVPAQPRAG